MTMFAIGATLLFSALSAVIAGFQIFYVGDPGKMEQISTLEMLDGLLAVFYFGVVIFSVVAYLMWLNLSVKNLDPLGVTRYKYTPGWAVGWWFVPFASLVMPFLVVRDLWKASMPGFTGEDWKETSATPMLGLWWAAWLLSSFVALAGIPAIMNSAPSVSDIRILYATGIAAEIFTIVAGLLCIFIMLQIDENQQMKAQEQGAASA